MKSLYRFMSFENFIDIVQSKQLTFVRPKVWEDPYESYVTKALRTDEGKRKIEDIVRQTFGQERLVDCGFLDQIEKYYYGQCWTFEKESDAFWRIYSYSNMAIRVQIDFDSISLLKSERLKVIHGPVDYKAYLDLKNELKRVFVPGQINALNLFLTKRDSFKHEKEYRLMIFDNSDITKDFVKVDFGHIDSYIKSVMLHPLAPEWFNETVRTYCNINGLSYLGKSQLYNLSF